MCGKLQARHLLSFPLELDCQYIPHGLLFFHFSSDLFFFSDAGFRLFPLAYRLLLFAEGVRAPSWLSDPLFSD